jgi:hypothetical protein
VSSVGAPTCTRSALRKAQVHLGGGPCRKSHHTRCTWECQHRHRAHVSRRRFGADEHLHSAQIHKPLVRACHLNFLYTFGLRLCELLVLFQCERSWDCNPSRSFARPERRAPREISPRAGVEARVFPTRGYPAVGCGGDAPSY